jgi:ATP phosphoribosyltransferase regulatory subunit
MDKYKMHVPDGVEDCLPAECYIKKTIESALRNAFILSGYDEIETPTYEHIDVFQSGVGSYIQESMIKFVDTNGRILVLRPDLTVPIARVAATKLQNMPQRLFYIQNSFAAAEPAIGKAGEFTQAGIELIGDESDTADAEVISLAVKALKTAGLKSFTVDIGQVSFFKSLISESGLKDNEVDLLRHAVDSKDKMAIEALSKQLNLSEKLTQQITMLPDLFGGSEVFEKALALSSKPACVAAVENLRNVYILLSEYGLSEYITIDLGMLHDIAYYSGIIFRGLATGIGFPVVSGGRYDELLGKFGKAASATGFALGIKRIMIAMERQGLLSGYYETDAVVSCAAPSCGAAYAFAESMRAQGKRTVFISGLDIGSLLKEKERVSAREAVYFDENGCLQTL